MKWQASMSGRLHDSVNWDTHSCTPNDSGVGVPVNEASLVAGARGEASIPRSSGQQECSEQCSECTGIRKRAWT